MIRPSLILAGAQIVKVAIQLGSAAILGRLIEPAAFGLCAMLVPLIALSGLFQDFGTAQLVTANAVQSDPQLNALFQRTLLTSVLAAFGVAALAYPISRFYESASLFPLCLCYAIPVLLDGWNTFPTAILTRDLRIGTLSAVEITSMMSGVVAGVAGALLLPGVWALYLSTTVSMAVKTVGMWIWNPWRPTPGRSLLPQSSALRRHKRHLTVANFLGFAARSLDNVLIGKVSGAEPLGLYDRAYRLMMFPLQNVNVPVGRLMLPALSRLRHDPEQLRVAYKRWAGLLTLMTMPAIAVAIALPGPVINILLGPRWLMAAPVFAWLGLAALAQSFNSTLGLLLSIQNQTRTLLFCSIYTSVVTVSGFAISVSFGPTALAATYAISGWLLRTPVIWAAMIRVGPVRLRDIAPVQAALGIAALVTFCVSRNALMSYVGGLSLILATAILSYGLALATLALTRDGRLLLADARRLCHV